MKVPICIFNFHPRPRDWAWVVCQPAKITQTPNHLHTVNKTTNACVVGPRDFRLVSYTELHGSS